MASPSYTYSLTNGTPADASQVMQNFNDILNGVTDGTKDLAINALTGNGTANLKGQVNLGTSSSNDVQFNGSLATTIPIKTNNSFAIGSSTKGLSGLFLGNGGVGATCQIISASHATTRNYTVPDCSAAASFVMSEAAQSINGVKTFNNGINLGNTTFSNYLEGTFTPTVLADGTAGTITYSIQVGAYCRIGTVLYMCFQVEWTNWTGSPTGNMYVDFSGIGLSARNTSNLRNKIPAYTNNINAPGTDTLAGFFLQIIPTDNKMLVAATYDNANSQSLDPAVNSGATTRAIRASGFIFL